MIQIVSLGVTITLRTNDAEEPKAAEFAGPPALVSFVKEELGRLQALGMFGNTIDLASVSANDLYSALLGVDLNPHFVEGRQTVPPNPETLTPY